MRLHFAVWGSAAAVTGSHIFHTVCLHWGLQPPIHPARSRGLGDDCVHSSVAMICSARLYAAVGNVSPIATLLSKKRNQQLCFDRKMKGVDNANIICSQQRCYDNILPTAALFCESERHTNNKHNVFIATLL